MLFAMNDSQSLFQDIFYLLLTPQQVRFIALYVDFIKLSNRFNDK